jgi:hypothetical protein
MSWLQVVASRLSGLFRKNKFEGEMDEEFRFHLDMQVEAVVSLLGTRS